MGRSDNTAQLDGLDAAQRAAVTSEAMPLCILAAAGSGKTRVLTHRIAHRIGIGAADPHHVLALTFTRRAAGELRSRLRTLGVDDDVTAATFHATAWVQLRRWAEHRGVRPPQLLADPARVVARFVGRAEAAEVTGEITWAKARLVEPAGYETAAVAAGRTTACSPAEVAAAFARYQEALRRGGLVDFDDLLLQCARVMEEEPRFAAAQRWWMRHFFVDEYQDLNPAQFRLLRAWLGDGHDLTVVGDPRQAVYGWNGADPELLHRFTEHFPTATVVRLDTAYRCPPEVLAVATALLPGAVSATGLGDGTGRPTGRLPSVRRYDTDAEEARAVARALRAARGPGTPWSDLVVLARTNAQLTVVEQALRHASIPHRSSSDLQMAPVRDAMQWLARMPAAVPLRSALADLDDDPALDLLRELGGEYAALDRTPSTRGFLAWLRLVVLAGEPAGGGDAVTLATFHRAKGLEWPVVFVVGLEHGLVPVAHAVTPVAVAEERRLLYVALTRATREVHCSWAAERTMGGGRADGMGGGRVVRRTPSPWLSVLERACADVAAGQAVDWRAHLRAGRARLAAIGS